MLTSFLQKEQVDKNKIKKAEKLRSSITISGCLELHFVPRYNRSQNHSKGN